MNPPLAHSRVTAPGAEPRHWIFALHGIYGRGRNWATLMRQLATERPEWGAVLVDLRLHGDSHAVEGPHTLSAAADDVAELVEHLGLAPTAILGHSFGGKVALCYGANAPDGLQQVWVIDSTPASKPPSGSAWGMIEAVRGMPAEFPSRGDFVERLKEAGYAEPVGQWMAMNLEPDEGSYRWRLNFEAMETMLRDFFQTDLLPLVGEPPPGVELHFIKAQDSNVLTPDVAEHIAAAEQATGRIFLHHLSGGHWLNTDNPQGILELLRARLP
jgi:pimeloyl-ACP methyl ester carboxylesterase